MSLELPCQQRDSERISFELLIELLLLGARTPLHIALCGCKPCLYAFYSGFRRQTHRKRFTCQQLQLFISDRRPVLLIPSSHSHFSRERILPACDWDIIKCFHMERWADQALRRRLSRN